MINLRVIDEMARMILGNRYYFIVGSGFGLSFSFGIWLLFSPVWYIGIFFLINAGYLFHKGAEIGKENR